MHTLYLGPSWAVQSYESYRGDTDLIKTNLAQELDFKNFTQIANYNNTNHQQLDLAEDFIQKNSNLGPFRIFLVMCDDLVDAYKQFNTTPEEFAQVFLTDSSPKAILKKLQGSVFQRLTTLNIPVAVVGAHTDILINVLPPNVTLIHLSWQKFLLEQIGLDQSIDQGWPAEIAHMWLCGTLYADVSLNIDFEPSRQIVFDIDRLFSGWTTLSHHNLWNGVHPNIRANQLFAEHIKIKVNQWLDKTDTIV